MCNVMNVTTTKEVVWFPGNHLSLSLLDLLRATRDMMREKVIVLKKSLKTSEIWLMDHALIMLTEAQIFQGT